MRSVCRADNLTTFMYRLSRNFGSLNLLEPYGPVQACTGMAFTYRFEVVFFITFHVSDPYNSTNLTLLRKMCSSVTHKYLKCVTL
jgi:hypothetical protein